MERGIPVKLSHVRTLFLSVLVCGYADVYAKEKVVLVTSQACPISTLSSLDLRKIFLGFKLRRDGLVIRAYRNLSDARLEQIFLQAVVAMSKKSYRRRLLWLRLNYGNPKISEFQVPEDFIDQLKTSPCGVTYMWEDSVPSTSGLKILDTLWQND